jgi:hypothetical protein
VGVHQIQIVVPVQHLELRVGKLVHPTRDHREDVDRVPAPVLREGEELVATSQREGRIDEFLRDQGAFIEAPPELAVGFDALQVFLKVGRLVVSVLDVFHGSVFVY